MINLKNPYISVSGSNGNTYGGNQQYCKNKALKRCGCGLVAALDSLIYLGKYNPSVYLPEYKALPLPIPQEKYEQLLSSLCRAYLPVLYPFGMNGLGLAAGMNLFFFRHSVPLKARWGISSVQLKNRITEMLSADIPVILAVGPNFPKFWQRKNASFRYSPVNDISPSVGTRAHFVTVTGIDDSWLEISSWGHKYFLSFEELNRYSRECSNSLLCNILYIEQK
jgi:hypothetical protein